MKKRIAFWVLSVVLVLGLVGCGAEGTTDDDTVVTVGSGVGVVEETPEPTEAPTPEPTEAPTPESTEVPSPVDEVTRIALLYIMGWGDDFADSMTQEEAIAELREYAKEGGGVWESAEDAQMKWMIQVLCTEDGTIYADLIATDEDMLSGLFGGTIVKDKINNIYINGALVEENWETVEIYAGDYIIIDMGSTVKISTNDVVEPTEEPVPTAEPEVTTEQEVEQSEDGTNPAFYNWVSKENEEADIAWYVETFGATEAELRTWDEEQWDYAIYVWTYGEAPASNNNKTIGYSVSVDGLAYYEEYYIEAETVYDVLVETGFYTYHGIKEIRVNGVVIDAEPQDIPVNDGDWIDIEAYDI